MKKCWRGVRSGNSDRHTQYSGTLHGEKLHMTFTIQYRDELFIWYWTLRASLRMNSKRPWRHQA